MALIIVEGSRKSGKTYLVSKQTELPVFKFDFNTKHVWIYIPSERTAPLQTVVGIYCLKANGNKVEVDTVASADLTKPEYYWGITASGNVFNMQNKYALENGGTASSGNKLALYPYNETNSAKNKTWNIVVFGLHNPSTK
jgi:hypothetical protein